MVEDMMEIAHQLMWRRLLVKKMMLNDNEDPRAFITRSKLALHQAKFEDMSPDDHKALRRST